MNLLNKFNLNAARALVSLAAYFFLNSCTYKNYGTTAPVSIYKINMSFPQVSTEGEVRNIVDSFYVATQDSFTVYRFLYERIRNIESTSPDSAGFFNSTTLGYVAQYFFHFNNDTLGIRYDSVTDSSPRRQTVRSFLDKKFKIKENSLFYLTDSLIQTRILNKDEISETYVRVSKASIMDFDTINLVFTKEKFRLPFSFSPKIENARKMKLVKLVFIQSPSPDNKNPVLRRRKEVQLGITKANENELSFLDDLKRIILDSRSR